ncbi:hypothetical protein [Pseudomonas taiwanensis]|uniref:hypothetical protein n=1 Tax=Pseudomonas taiwanensis TaxID=470150 RepID=UPI0016465BA0|nr:hypothetical protein [Pseudomonas taiwanensis]MBC3493588.1 hypothetical protein [Pseudomonas taiwanensis]
MKIGGIEYLVSFLLLLLGFVFGSLTPKEEFFTVGVSDIFQILAAVGTVVAAVIAIPGLNSWRKQFKHGEKIKRLEGLRTIDAALSALYSHCESCNRYVASKLRGEDGAVLDEEVSKTRSLFFDSHGVFSNSWRDARIVMEPSEVNRFRWSPDKLLGFYLELATSILQVEDQTRSDEVDKSPFLILMREYNLSRVCLSDAVLQAREDIDTLIRANI